MTRTKRPLAQRLKKNELYVVFSGYDFEDATMHMIGYGDPERTPRIYKHDSFDDRLDTDWPVCSNFRSAVKRTNGKTFAVLLPLAEMIKIFGDRKVKRWARVQGHVAPQEVREYVNRFVAMRQAA